MVKTIYLSAFEFIREREFDMITPAFYQPELPEEMTNPKPFQRQAPNPYKMTPMNAPPRPILKQFDDPYQPQHTKFSVEIMVDMHQKKIVFELVYEDDIVEIMDGIDRYLITLYPDVASGVNQSIEFAKMIVDLRQELYKIYYRYMQTHPAAKEALYPQNNPEENIFTALSMAGLGSEFKNMDPLLAKAKPPFDIEKTKPVSVGQVDDMGLSSLYGIPKAGVSADDGKDFSLDEFLKKGR